MFAKDRVEFLGHPMVTALHPTTLEITRDHELTASGDCVIGVAANKAALDLSPALRLGLARGATVKVRLEVEGEVFALRARGDTRLTLTDSRDIVIRKSTFVSGRTLAITATAAAKDVPRTMVNKLKRIGSRGTMWIEATLP